MFASIVTVSFVGNSSNTLYIHSDESVNMVFIDGSHIYEGMHAA